MIIGTLVMSLPVVQTKLAKYATNRLNNEFGTNIQINRLSFSFFTLNTTLKDIYIEDYKKDTLAYMQKMSTSILSLRNLRNGKMEFGDIDVNGLIFNLKTYEGERDTNLDVFVDKLDDGKPREPGTPPFFLSSSEVHIADGQFRLIDENLEKHEILNFSNLNVAASDFQILGPDVSLNIDNLNMMAKRGIELKKLSSKFKYTKQQMQFDSLLIQTPQSSINADLVFDYDREDLRYFTDSVGLNANFKESTIALNEINLFFDEFGSDKIATLSGNASGTLNNFELSDLFLVSDNTGIRGDYRFHNILIKRHHLFSRAQ